MKVYIVEIGIAYSSFNESYVFSTIDKARQFINEHGSNIAGIKTDYVDLYETDIDSGKCLEQIYD